MPTTRFIRISSRNPGSKPIVFKRYVDYNKMITAQLNKAHANNIKLLEAIEQIKGHVHSPQAPIQPHALIKVEQRNPTKYIDTNKEIGLKNQKDTGDMIGLFIACPPIIFVLFLLAILT